MKFDEKRCFVNLIRVASRIINGMYEAYELNGTFISEFMVGIVCEQPQNGTL